MNKYGLLVVCGMLAFYSQSCKPDDSTASDCFVPDAAVNMTINMDLPEYYNLRNLGEYIEINQGNRGVYLIHNYDDIFYAVERTCPYEADQECSRVFLDGTILQLRCGEMIDTTFVECCASTYSFNSAFITGPTRCNLKTYRVRQSGNSLFVSN